MKGRDSKLPRDYIFPFCDRNTISLPLLKRAFSMDYTINGVYTRNGNQYCPIAIMLHRDCHYTMQLSTTRRTCQERNEGDQWIFNCQYGTDSRQNFGALYNWPTLFPAANYNRYLPHSRLANEIQNINNQFTRTSSINVTHYVPAMTNQVEKHGYAN